MKKKMSKKRILLFSQNNHAFIFNDIAYAAQCYEQIVVVTPNCEEMKKTCEKFSNVSYSPYTAKWTLKLLISVLKNIDKTIISEFLRALINKKVDLNYIKDIFYYLLNIKVIKEKTTTYVKDEGKAWILLSMWFHSTAYAICKMKSVYPQIKLVSLAHAFEIDDLRNKQIDYSCKKVCHDNVDYISFISKTMLNRYMSNHVVPNSWRSNNLGLNYLGVKRYENIYVGKSTGQEYHILTCSRCIELKRLNLLIEALDLIKSYKIRWTHIGDGPLLKDLMRTSEMLGSNIAVEWMGAMNYNDVHRYYSKTHIDLFVNLSTTEGLPVSILEAMAYGVPVLATNVGGTPEVVNEKTGYLLCENPSSQAIADALLQCIKMDDNDKNRMREASINEYEDVFNADIIRKEFYELIKYK